MTVLLPLFAALAWAGAPPRFLEAGTGVRVEAVGRRDAFWRFRDELEGLVCVVDEPGLVRHRGRWYAGALTCNDGQQYYFYQVQVVAGDYGQALGSVLPAPEPPELEPEPPPAPVPAPTAPRPPPATTPGPAPRWPVGATVRIRAISAADTRSAEGGRLVGARCEVVQSPLEGSGADWWAGSLRCEDGGVRYFYQVALDEAPGTLSP